MTSHNRKEQISTSEGLSFRWICWALISRFRFGDQKMGLLFQKLAFIEHVLCNMQVMLIKNLETSVGLVNGARGVVVRFSDPDDPSTKEFERLGKHINPANRWPFVRFACDGIDRLLGPESWSVFEGEKEVAKRTQVRSHNLNIT